MPQYIIPKTPKGGIELPFNPYQPNLATGAAIALSYLNPYTWSSETKVDAAPDGYKLNVESNSYELDPAYKQSLLGTPLVGQLIFNPDNKQTFQNYNNLNGPSVTVPTFSIDNCILTIDQNKRIVKTNVNGRDGGIIEYTGLDNYDIRINGTILSNQNGFQPDITNLIKICEAPICLKVQHSVLNFTFNVHYIFITEYNITQEEGGISQQKVEITAQSDDPNTYLALFNITK